MLNTDFKEEMQSWLSRLSLIADYKTKRQEIALLIYKALDHAEKCANFRDVFLSCISEAGETCGDHVALSIIRLDVQFKIRQCNELGELAYLIGHGIWALDLLETIASNKVKQRN